MKLIAYSASESGGMTGGQSSESITYTDDGRCLVSIADRPFHGQPTRCVRYYDDGLLEKLSEVCKRYDILQWTELPSRIIVMRDEPVCKDVFTFEDGTRIAFDSRQIYPDRAREMFREISRLKKASESSAGGKEVTEETPLMTMGLPSVPIAGPSPTFRSGCGTAQTSGQKFCSECGTALTPGQKFCAECGAKLR